jgi:hypothetical protein
VESPGPVVETISAQATPGDELAFGQLTALMPVFDEMDDFIA